MEGLTLTPGMRWNRKSLTTQSPVGSSLRDGALGLEREDSESRNPQIPLFMGAPGNRPSITFEAESTLPSIHFSASSWLLRHFILVSSNSHQSSGSAPTRQRQTCVPFLHSEDTMKSSPPGQS